jgi:hypothetical protein
MHRDHARARAWLAGIRIVNGALGLAAPSFLAGRAGGLPNPATTYAFRLFGIRTVLLGADLLSGDTSVRRHAAQAAPWIHGSDVATASMLLLRRQVPTRTGVMLTAISALNLVLALRARES